MRSLPFLVWMVLVGAALQPRPLSGQVVRGQLLSGDTGIPLEGAMMVLQADGQEVGVVLTNGAGRFILRMVSQVQVIELEGLSIEGESRCTVRPEAGRAVALVWEEARKALTATAFTEEQGLYRYRIVRFLRELDERARRVLQESRRVTGGYLKTPFESLPAETLVGEGFFREDPEGDLYFAPDAAVLLSDPFLDTHCLGLTPGRGESDGLMGVAFEPIPGRDLPEIRGVIWLDPVTSELRRLDYRYENLDPGLRNDAVGGRVTFQGLPNGSWIVRDWRIRMPNATVAPDFRGGRQLILSGIREVGGSVERVQDDAGNIVLEAAKATLTGTVFDSTGTNPLVGAVVEVAGTSRSGRSGAAGSFRITGLGGGVYAVRMSHPDAPALGMEGNAVEVELSVGEISHLRLVATPLSEILAEACSGEGQAPGAAVISGVVRDGETGLPVAGASIRILWTNYRFRATDVVQPAGAGRWRSLLGIQNEGLQGRADESGRYLACAVPAHHPLELEAESDGLTSGVLAFRIPEGERYSSVDLQIVKSGVGSVLGRVVEWESGDPLENASVYVEGAGRSLLTDEGGRFHLNEIPLGRQILSVQALGRSGAVDTVQIRPDKPLELEVRLPTEAIALEGFTVEVLSREEREILAEGWTGATVDRIDPKRMDEIRDRVDNVVDAIRTMGSPRIRITEYSPQGFAMGFCARWNRRRPSIVGEMGGGGCQSMLIILDGRPLNDALGNRTIPASAFLLDMEPEEIESVRVLSPVQAEFRYGLAGENGALVIETRRGRRGEGWPPFSA